MDSTILTDAVATQDTITQLIAAVRRVARQVPGAADQIAAVCTGHDYTRPGKPTIDWDDPTTNIERVVSHVANRGGRRLKLRYRGTDPNNAWLKRRTAALNLRNLINRGLDHAAGWILTTA